jgi:periplasmic protein TonB
MSYKSLLFCPDEKTARIVTQVLSELDFSVELSNEPFAAVKKLSAEHFDALVVDCQNEQDASLLFKGARNSTHNHSSLSVAVVEGQVGVAKAFRIGANLVLTKPINIEQSKGTLRVARGLLRKSAAKSAASSIVPSAASSEQVPSFTPNPASASMVMPTVASAAALSSVTPAAPSPAGSFSVLEVEQEPTPAPEAAEVAVLESLPELSGNPSEQRWAPAFDKKAEPTAVSAAGHAAAAAPAPEKIKPIELHVAGAAPMVTNEPIVKETSSLGLPEQTPVSAPTFSSLDARTESKVGGTGFLKIAAILLLCGAAGYMAWQRFHPLQYLHRPASPTAAKQPMLAPATSTALNPPTQAIAVSPDTSMNETAAVPAAESTVPASPAPSAPPHNSSPEAIHVQELQMFPDQKITVTPKVQPIVVKARPRNVTEKAGQPLPPSLAIASGNDSDTALANIVPANAPLPRPSLGSVRVSQGVAQGLILKKVAPVYPAIALQLHKRGAVELLATISKQGTITSIQVFSGDALLAKSAVDAVRQWKYRPYLLNGEPVEIQTQITVNFNLSH